MSVKVTREEGLYVITIEGIVGVTERDDGGVELALDQAQAYRLADVLDEALPPDEEIDPS